MRRIATACVLAALTACASGQSSSAGGTSSMTTSAPIQSSNPGTSGTISITNTISAAKSTVNLPIDKAWVALDKAFTVMTIPPTERNVATHTLANSSLRVRRKLGDVQLIRALDCGGDTSSPNAETYDITLSVRTRLTAETPTSTMMETLIEGTGKNTLTNSINQVNCYSTGGIEKRLTELVKKAGGEAPGVTMTRKPPME